MIADLNPGTRARRWRERRSTTAPASRNALENNAGERAGAAFAHLKIAFSYREVPEEVDFFLACARRAGASVGRALELASGPGAHARELARRGIHAVALDRSEPMVELAHPSIWTISEGDVRVETRWHTNAARVDWTLQRCEVACKYLVDDHGERVELSDRGWLRMTLPSELQGYAEAAGFEVRELFGSFDPAQPLDDSPGAWRSVVVLQKPHAAHPR